MHDKDYWQDRYHRQATGWDIGYPSPPLIHIIDQVALDATILLPGAGYGHEVAYMLDRGYTDVTVIDLVADVYDREHYRRARESGYRLLVGDFFSLTGTFDLILEQTFFCALDPALRSAYVDHMADLLAPSGELRGVLFDRAFDHAGPPYGGYAEGYRSLFSTRFSELSIEPCQMSIAPRAGQECLLRASL